MSAREDSPGISAQSSFLRDSVHMASTPDVNITVHDAGHPNSAPSAGNSNMLKKKNLPYKSHLKYLPSKDFVEESTPINGASAPNTFKHKSHPNAKTKSHIMLLTAEERQVSVTEDLERPLLSATAVSQHSPNVEPTDVRDWLPSYLNESWKEYSVHADPDIKNAPGADPYLDPFAFINSGTETLVHKKSNEKAIPIADWKQAHQKSERGRLVRPLESIFLSSSIDSAAAEPTVSPDGTDHKLSISLESTYESQRTPPTRVSDLQVHEIENFLEQNQDMPDNHLIQVASPLKLYGKKYDTFTKAFLSGIVQDVRRSGRKVKQPEPATRPPGTKVKINIVDRSTQNYLANADKVYENIRKIGSGYGLNQHKFSNELAKETARLSDKNDTEESDSLAGKAENLHISLNDTFDYTAESTSVSSDDEEILYERRDYTEHEQSCSIGVDQQSYTVAESLDRDSFTLSQEYSDTTVFNENRSASANSHNAEQESDHITFAESSFPDASSDLGGRTIYSEDALQESPKTPEWKTVDKLWLGMKLVHISTPKQGAALKGTVKPGDFPKQYGNMKMNRQNNRWDFDGKKPGLSPAFESFKGPKGVDFQVAGDFKSAMNESKKRKKGIEVSFVDADQQSAVNSVANVTQVSALQDISFSQSDRRIVSLITNATTEVDWNRIRSIDLPGCDIEQLAGLDAHLPALRRVNLARNRIRHFEGLPQALFELDISRNELRELVSFQKFRDLQDLFAQFNFIGSLSCLSHNVNLTQLNLEGNKITSLRGLEALNNLRTLNLRLNSIEGALDFSTFDATKLQELNLSSNKITAVAGLAQLAELRVLNLSDNSLSELRCVLPQLKLKKLVLSLNHLERLDVTNFPHLRVLRIDGNALVDVQGLAGLQYLQEVSAKFQKLSETTSEICRNINDAVKLDLSGNRHFFREIYKKHLVNFWNLNELCLTALNLLQIPEDLAYNFPNVRLLRLDFNNLSDIAELLELANLKELYLTNNNISKVKPLLTSLCNSKETLKVLDLKENPLTIPFYAEFIKGSQWERKKRRADVVSDYADVFVDDYESFVDVSRVMEESRRGWHARDASYASALLVKNPAQYESRLDYEALMIQYFPWLEELDGILITEQKCRKTKKHARRTRTAERR